MSRLVEWFLWGDKSKMAELLRRGHVSRMAELYLRGHVNKLAVLLLLVAGGLAAAFSLPGDGSAGAGESGHHGQNRSRTSG